MRTKMALNIQLILNLVVLLQNYDAVGVGPRPPSHPSTYTPRIRVGGWRFYFFDFFEVLAVRLLIESM